jgi:hypothetical protein
MNSIKARYDPLHFSLTYEGADIFCFEVKTVNDNDDICHHYYISGGDIDNLINMLSTYPDLY